MKQFIIRMILSAWLLWFVWHGNMFAFKVALTLSLIAHEIEAILLKIVLKAQNPKER